jgi:hypothetical protein
MDGSGVTIPLKKMGTFGNFNICSSGANSTPLEYVKIREHKTMDPAVLMTSLDRNSAGSLTPMNDIK